MRERTVEADAIRDAIRDAAQGVRWVRLASLEN